ncbi:RrF2 family transcriptional regulator [Phocicoccus pinnipedialis]|uniref:HTH-type transcriptional regulator CymR n=1 Tax=Phocicoccus pinnipedialis TaxID=110845 RepID=A0A6V7RGA7_9BACL|nr:Rrf2 family transcriptional regulator [Jeotgalicoccus pinnipedialis]CAD2076266.1 HTH-type transcriptional regulator CymR [Jeotgalicoccus pinnipedialis]
MFISTKGRYGLYFMTVLADSYNVERRSVKSVATEREISDLYLEQIVAKLKRAKLVKSTRGAYGGYELNMPPEEISVYMIFKAVGENILIIEQDEKDTKNEKYLWREMRDAISGVMKNTSLYDLITSPDEIEEYMFYI